MNSTPIEWTTRTWNPTTGCTEVSPGCDHCLAARTARTSVAKRYLAQAPVVPSEANAADPFAVRLWETRLAEPEAMRTPSMILVNSMSDLFHPDIPGEFVARVFEVMLRTSRHIYQVLTKRPDRAAAFVRQQATMFPSGLVPAHIWIGTSIEDQERAHRIDHLREVPAATRFLSCEPLLGSIEFDHLGGIQWVIAGGESGPAQRHLDLAWVRSLRDQCLRGSVPFFFKQAGRAAVKPSACALDGRTWDEYPAAVLPIRSNRGSVAAAAMDSHSTPAAAQLPLALAVPAAVPSSRPMAAVIVPDVVTGNVSQSARLSAHLRGIVARLDEIAADLSAVAGGPSIDAAGGAAAVVAARAHAAHLEPAPLVKTSAPTAAPAPLSSPAVPAVASPAPAAPRVATAPASPARSRLPAATHASNTSASAPDARIRTLRARLAKRLARGWTLEPLARACEVPIVVLKNWLADTGALAAPQQTAIERYLAARTTTALRAAYRAAKQRGVKSVSRAAGVPSSALGPLRGTNEEHLAPRIAQILGDWFAASAVSARKNRHR